MIIKSMSEEERSNPDLLVGASGPGRRRRIAKKANVDVSQVNNNNYNRSTFKSIMNFLLADL